MRCFEAVCYTYILISRFPETWVPLNHPNIDVCFHCEPICLAMYHSASTFSNAPSIFLTPTSSLQSTESTATSIFFTAQFNARKSSNAISPTKNFHPTQH